MNKESNINLRGRMKAMESWLLIFFACILILKPLGLLYAEVVFIYAVAIGMVVVFGYLIENGARIPLDWPSCTLYCFTIWEWISLLWADQISLGWPVACNWLLLTLIYVLIRNVELNFFKASSWVKFGWVIIFINLVLVLGALCFFNFVDSEFSYKYIERTSRFLCSYPNLLTSLFVLTLPGLFYLLTETKLNSILKILALSSYIFVIVIFQSKGTIIALIVLVIAFLVFGKNRNKFRYVLVAGIFSFCALLLIYALIPDKIEFLSKYNPILSYLNLTGDDRVLIWMNTLEMIKNDPWFGVGSGNWKLAFLQFGVSEHTYFIKYHHAHNFYLQTFAEKGVVGILLLLELFYCPIYLYIKKKELFGDHSFYYLLSIVAFYILCFFYGIADNFKYLLIYIIALALFLNKDKSSLVAIPKFLKIITVCLFVFSILVIGTKFYQRLTFYKIKNEKITGEASIQKLKEIHLTGITEFNRIKPIEGYIADEYFKLSDYEQALTWYKKALSQSPNDDHLHFGLGTTLSKLGNHENALSALKKAATLNTGNLEAQLELFRVAIIVNSKTDIKRQNEIFHHVIEIKDENYNFYLKNLNNTKVKSYWDKQCEQIDEYFSLLENYNDKE